MKAVVAAIDEFADDPAPVLITGEHGTGREHVARVLHQRGPHAHLALSTLRPGDETLTWPAYTVHAKDVTDLSRPTQRALAELSDVHLIASADLDVDHAARASILVPELYALFTERRIVVPPLRERLEDLAVLFERWLAHYATEIGRTKPTVSSRAIDRMQSYPWPGNAAELKAIARRLVVRVTRPRIEAEDLDEVLPRVAARVPLEDLSFEDLVKSKLGKLLDQLDGYPVDDLHAMIVERVERPLFELVLARTGNNQVKAAALLGIDRNTLRKKLTPLPVAGRASPAPGRRSGSRR